MWNLKQQFVQDQSSVRSEIFVERWANPARGAIRKVIGRSNNPCAAKQNPNYANIVIYLNINNTCNYPNWWTETIPAKLFCLLASYFGCCYAAQGTFALFMTLWLRRRFGGILFSTKIPHLRCCTTIKNSVFWILLWFRMLVAIPFIFNCQTYFVCGI